MYQPFNAIDVTDSYDFNEDDEEQGERCSVIIEYRKPVTSGCGCKAQANKKAEYAHQA